MSRRVAGVGPWLCALVFAGECPGDDLDLGGTGQRDPHQVGLVVVVLEKVMCLGGPGAGSWQAADGDLIDASIRQCRCRGAFLYPPGYPGNYPRPAKGTAIQSYYDQDQSMLQRGALGVRQQRGGEAELH